MAKKGDGKKGTFSFLRLPIAKQYVWPESRFKMFLIGFIGVLLFGAYFAVDRFLGKGDFISNGPVSSFHAGFEKDCSACHSPAKSVSNEKCAACHELKGNKLGTFAFAAHYVYRSGDPKRATHKSHEEVPCFSCHTEHTGRNASITNVPDSTCENCHQFGSFNSGHPEFAFLQKKIPDDKNLEFAHTQHVREIMTRRELKDVENACVVCHNPKPDGKTFHPISFENHCGSCHLAATDKTPPLPERDPANPKTPGVETLEAIQQRGDPGTRWAFFVSPSEVSKRGGGVVKSPLYHPDPWIMENLNQARRMLYPDQGLSDLLRTTGITAKDAPAELYQEAIQTLKNYATDLRGHPDAAMQNELSKLEELIKLAEQKLRDPSVAINSAAFMTPPKMNPSLNAQQADEWKTLALDLTEACRKCHVVSDAAIQHVQKDQTMMRRAEFNHSTHMLDRKCLDCHSVIPISKLLKTTGAINSSDDSASIQNLPGIENCKNCHTQKAVSNRCITCHEFHPNKANRFEAFELARLKEGEP